MPTDVVYGQAGASESSQMYTAVLQAQTSFQLHVYIRQRMGHQPQRKKRAQAIISKKRSVVHSDRLKPCPADVRISNYSSLS